MKKIIMVFVLAFIGFNVFAQDYTSFDYRIDAKNFNIEIFERGMNGKESIPDYVWERLVTMVQNGHVIVYPNQHKTVWYDKTVEQLMSIKDSEKMMNGFAHFFALYCGNFEGNYLYWSNGWLMTKGKMFFEYSSAWNQFDLYRVW